jgi:hypothetical protein
VTTSLDFVVVGAQRAGSTELAARLGQHPELYVCPDEVPYFENPFFPNSRPASLEPALQGASPGQRRGIHCPSYLGRTEVAPRIADHSPGARIVATLRDPVARSVSVYFWYVQFGMLPLEPLPTGMERLLDGWSDPAYPHAGEVLDWSFYGRLLQRYLDVFPSDQVLAVTMDELDAPGGMASVYRFLGVDSDHHHRPVGRPRNTGVYDLRRLRVLRARRRFAWSWDDTTTYRYRARRLRKPLRFLPNAAVVGFDRVVLSRVFGNAVPALPAPLEARMRDLFADDVRLLESLIGSDLSGWRRPRSSAV